jgi:malonyl-CoA/methylmalonyl-CoA synthetase
MHNGTPMASTTPQSHLPPGHASELLADGSLPGRWTRRWRERPAAQQLRGPDGRWISTDELEERTRHAAERLRATGLTRGERFILSAEPSAELVIAYIAALRAGLVVVPLNTAYTETEVQRIVRDAAPAAAAVDDDERGRWIADACAGCENVGVYGIDLSLQLPNTTTAPSIDETTAEDPALLVYTSGTTGRPKGALLTHANLMASATAVNLAWRWEPEDCLLLTLPLFHVHGLGVGLNGSLCAGAAVSLRPRFDPGDVAEQCQQGTSMFFGVPAMYQRLAAADRLDAFTSLRLLVSGSAPLPAALATEIAKATGQIPLERYGMTETLMLTSNPYAGERRPGTVGFPLPGVELRLAPTTGEVEVRGPNVIAGYYLNPEANAAAFTDDGWFRTGDLGEVSDDGYLRLVGRSKELIITGGFNVYPREVEEVLQTHPSVAEVAVVGRPSEQWGEEVTAVVVKRGELETEDLRTLAASHLAPYKVPKRVEFIDQLPRNALGKVIRSRL